MEIDTDNGWTGSENCGTSLVMNANKILRWCRNVINRKTEKMLWNCPGVLFPISVSPLKHKPISIHKHTVVYCLLNNSQLIGPLPRGENSIKIGQKMSNHWLNPNDSRTEPPMCVWGERTCWVNLRYVLFTLTLSQKNQQTGCFPKWRVI